MVHHSVKYNSEDNLLEDKKTFSSKVNETEKPFKDNLGYPSNPPNPLNPLNPLNPPNPPSPSNPSSPSHPPNRCPHPPNPRFKDSQSYVQVDKGRCVLSKTCYRIVSHNK